MHELSIAESIIDIAVETLHKHNGRFLKEIVLEIGTASGIEISALEFALSSLLKANFESMVVVNISKINAIAYCIHCKKDFVSDAAFPFCPDCNNFSNALKQGKELKIKSIEIE
jgi:hydrogenase nickel incorporation protein HypA/HybF